MTQDVVKKSGAPIGYRDDRGGAVLIPHPVIGIVKDNIDPTHSGRIKVYIARFGGNDPDNSSNWRTVKYLSPWFGTISPNYDPKDGTDKTGYGSFKGNPQSYGFWASAPDVGSQVVCIFLNGDPQDGYYIGCVPIPGLTHMVPAVGASSQVVPNAAEAESIAGNVRLPVTEVNFSNPEIRNSSVIYLKAKPVHSYQASVLDKQGLIRDNLRGVIGSTSQRETPSRVFGISTPGQAIYTGGFTRANLAQAVGNADDSELQIIGRTGGHSIVLDDGDFNGQDQLMRFRTSAGHMIMMNDSGQVLTIMHSNGQSYIELGKEGTIDLYSSNSVNIRTEGDLNFHSDRDINLHAKRNLTMFGDNVKTEADKNIEQRAGQNFVNFTQVNYTINVNQSMQFTSSDVAGITSGKSLFVNGEKILLNSGSSPVVAPTLPELTKINHVDTTYSPNKGWINPSPDPLLSITSRTPAHMPWVGANKGVNVQTGSAQPASVPQPTASVQAANQAATQAPQNPTNPAVLSTVPPVNAPQSSTVSSVVPPQTLNAFVSQQAVTGATASAADKLKMGITSGVAGATLDQLAQPGQSIKPGAADHIKALQSIAPMLPGKDLVPSTLLTGVNARVYDDINQAKAQIPAVVNAVVTSSIELQKAGILTGKESPTEAGGVLLASANLGVDTVKQALQNPQGVAAKIGQNASLTPLGKYVSAGAFAAGLADKFTSGLGGAYNSLNGMTNGALSGISTGVTDYFNKQLNGVTKLIKSVEGAAKAAYALAEKSFGSLKANQPNNLVSTATELGVNTDKNVLLLNELTVAKQELDAAESELVQAKRDYREFSDEESLNLVRQAENKLAIAEQKIAQINQKVLQANIPGVPSAQNLAAIAAAKQSGQLNAPGPLNTGINAIVGGVGAFASQVNNKVTNLLGSIKQVTQSAGNNVVSAISNPSSIAGNLITNTKNILNNVVNSQLVSDAKTLATKLTTNITSLVGSTGANSGGVVPATLAEKTFKVTDQINSKMGTFVGPGVPLPIFEETEFVVLVQKINQERADSQTRLETLIAERTLLGIQLDRISLEYQQDQNTGLLPSINIINEEIKQLDSKIAIEQATYNYWSTNRAPADTGSQ